MAPAMAPPVRTVLERARQEHGVGLVELTMVMVFLGIAFTVFASIFSSTINHNGQVSEANVLQTEVRAVVDGIAQELRSAYTGDSSSPLETIAANEIVFLTPDRAQPFHLRRVHYRVSGHTLERRFATSTDTDGAPWTYGSYGGWHPRFDAIVGTQFFTYLDAAGVVTAVPAAVRTIVITVALEPKSGRGRQVTYKTSATIRASQA
jgi:hypothetical protein